ncbi:snRNA-activating protein complex subunit 3 isoform X2 [Cryptotermes secundus]|uniref:snRNA-activating protein complex subunit 3 isoform X2 n=1 Tax=Cryptotermes secundus TaxID=105785 RepID=UPI001454D300|nr:snRNA-activating protein complex subunit 3 isoform X2 [Cryptotermes secundus]
MMIRGIIDQLQVPDEPPLVDVKCVKARPGLFDKCKIPAAASNLETLKCLSKRIVNDQTVGHLKYRSNIWITDAVHQTQDLEIGKHLIVTVRVYHPFRHKVGVRISNPPRCSQEVVLLGEQMLTRLRDKIVCPSDLAVSGELSENPDQKFTQRTMDIYKSGFIFIEDTFYNDHRDRANLDYSRVIRDWAVTHGLGPFKTAFMEKTKFEDLTVRLGYPYVYQHQGNCEHLIVFSDVRLLHKSDSLSSHNYPSFRSISSTNAQYCMICNYFVARWLTCENERVPYDPCFFCEHCFRSYNYIDGNKVGHFKAYPFFDRTAV